MSYCFKIMSEIPLWNQSRLACPATSAHKVDLSESSHLQVITDDFLKKMAEKPKKLKEILLLMSTDIVLLKRFLYKLAAVFAHDKSYKVLKHIHKTVNKFLETDITADITSFQEQHTVSSFSSKVIYVAPKPKYEYILVRLQGTVRLQAQILCLCQHYGSLLIRKMKLGHFVNITVISMSITSRIWALTLHIMHSLIYIYDSINKIYRTEGLIPTSTVNFLPDNYIVPLCLLSWIKSDATLKDIQPLLSKRKCGSKKMLHRKEDIWQMINIDGDDERQHLVELKELVASSNVGNAENEAALSLEHFQSNTTVDIGEPIVRDPTTLITKKKKKRRAKKRKGSPLEN